MFRDSRLRAELMRFVYSRERWPGLGSVWSPPVDVFESENALIVRVEIAGMARDDFDVVLTGRRLVVRGERRDRLCKRAYYTMAVPFGRFAADVDLPSDVPYDAERVSATYENGFLIVDVPIVRGVVEIGA